MSEPFLSEIKLLSFNFAPKGWALCNGQLLPINQNQALFALLGTTYGGNGQTTFALPNLQGRVPISMGNGHTLGEAAGVTSVTLNQSQMPAHIHALNADATTSASNTPGTDGTAALGRSSGVASPPGTFNVQIYRSGSADAALNPAVISNTGGSQPHMNMQPMLVLNYSIALQGIFPSRN